jgi:hypothetical protein
MRKRSPSSNVAALVALVAATSACDRQPTAPEDGNAANDAMAVAAITATMRPSSLTAGERHVQACPAGGRLVVEGSGSFEYSDQGTVNEWDMIMRHEACAVSLNGRTATADGEMHLWGEARHGPPVEQVSPILFQRSFQVGAMTTTIDGHSITCAYDLSHVYEPERGDYLVTGSVCGRSISIRAPARP